jgi:hypothetical protein
MVEKNGSSVFKVPKILRTESYAPKYFAGTRVFGARRMRITDDILPDLHPALEEVLRNWEYRKLLWSHIRPWHQVEYRMWSLSPWSWVFGREIVGQFRRAHAQRDLGLCLEWARTLLGCDHHHTETRGTPNENPLLWLWISIGALMIATIPILRIDLDYAGKASQIEIFPSRTSIPPSEVSASGSITFTQGQREFLRTSGTTVKTSWAHPNEGILYFMNVFYPGAQKHALPKVWLAAVLDTGRAIWARHSASASPDQWLPFDFDIPPYDTEWAIARDTHFTGVDGLTMLAFEPAAPPASDDGRLVSPPGTPAMTALEDLPDPSTGTLLTSLRQRSHRDRGVKKETRPKATPRYYTISEVGNHILRNDSTWVVEPDGHHGFDVYRITSDYLPPERGKTER